MSEYFIITAGPTGSGKTKLIDETLKVLGLEHTPVKKYLIDDYVESDPRYKERVKEIIKEVEEDCKESKNNQQQCIKQAYDNPSPALFKKFRDAYFEARKMGCTEKCRQKKIDMNHPCTSCNIALNLNLKNLSKNNSLAKVAVFETTGMGIPSWLLTDNTYVPANSKIVIGYSLVGLQELVKRNKSRAYQSILEFKANNSKPAPRLPDVSENTFKGVINTIRKVLIDLFSSCILQRNVKCGNRPIHQLVIFDNNGPSHKLLFTSMDETHRSLSVSAFTALIDKSLGGTMNGGKKKRGKSHTRRMGKARTRRARVSMT